MLSTSISNEYEWKLTASGIPDMRKAQNRDNVCNMVKRLDYKLKKQKQLHEQVLQETIQENNVLKSKISIQNNTANDCPICMEQCQGITILKCGHIMCPECFAQHSRVNNKCPLCRDEFAEEPHKQRANMPRIILEAMADDWTERNCEQNYFERAEAQFNSKRRGGERQEFIKWFFRENGKIMMRMVSRWYDE